MRQVDASVMQSLPIAKVSSEVCEALQVGNVILQAEPGAGKSTGLPLYLLGAGFDGKILLLEPRRIAAINVAKRLASQLDEKLGQTVGLRMRGRTEVGGSTRLEVVTEGVLTRILQADPMLDGVSLVIFDEFHERSLQADLGLALCLDVQRGLREDLRLLLMSATLDGEALCAHVHAPAPIVCHVRQHPVDVVWLGESKSPLPQAVSRAVIRAVAEQRGDILVFLPGVAEIERTALQLQGRLSEEIELHRLHGAVSSQAQSAATAASGACRRVILSTSIAETSITIDGVRVVVDCGLERRSKVDANGVERLETVTASQASATQRAGRAGRTQAGVCYRLWSESTHSRRAERWQPELLRAELSSLLIELGQWGIAEVDDLPWVDLPPVAAIDGAKRLLCRLGLWAKDGLTA
ncbi:MAG: helicase-related protein, partial [Granulosicoccaceae bacterium]